MKKTLLILIAIIGVASCSQDDIQGNNNNNTGSRSYWIVSNQFNYKLGQIATDTIHYNWTQDFINSNTYSVTRGQYNDTIGDIIYVGRSVGCETGHQRVSTISYPKTGNRNTDSITLSNLLIHVADSIFIAEDSAHFAWTGIYVIDSFKFLPLPSAICYPNIAGFYSINISPNTFVQCVQY